MAPHRFFATGPVPDEGPLPLSVGDAHHIRDVLRMEPGDEIVVVHDGAAMSVRLTNVGGTIRGELLGVVQTRALPRVTLAQGLPKGDKMDTIVRQVTELGVIRIVPFVAERSVVRLTEAKGAERAGRWRRIAEEAAKQSQRLAVPEVLQPVDAEGLATALEGSAVIVCWEESVGGPGVGEALRALPRFNEVAIVVGPEGGLTTGEVQAMQARGAVAVSLGETVLRTETAGVVAPALVIYELGGLGARA